LSFTEQRKHERVAVDIYVYWGRTEDCRQRDRIVNLGVGGCFIRTDERVPPGQPVYVKFWLPDERTIQGEVRYQLERWGVGVEFTGLSRAEAAHLSALVEYYRDAVPQ
jgi:hypothetical protein